MVDYGDKGKGPSFSTGLKVITFPSAGSTGRLPLGTRLYRF